LASAVKLSKFEGRNVITYSTTGYDEDDAQEGYGYALDGTLNLTLTINLPSFLPLPPGFNTIGSKIVQSTCKGRLKQNLKEISDAYLKWRTLQHSYSDDGTTTTSSETPTLTSKSSSDSSIPSTSSTETTTPTTTTDNNNSLKDVVEGPEEVAVGGEVRIRKRDRIKRKVAKLLRRTETTSTTDTASSVVKDDEGPEDADVGSEGRIRKRDRIKQKLAKLLRRK